MWYGICDYMNTILREYSDTRSGRQAQSKRVRYKLVSIYGRSGGRRIVQNILNSKLVFYLAVRGRLFVLLEHTVVGFENAFC
jgi:hypothetical protein